MSSVDLSHGDYTVAWICALPLEMAAAEVILEETHKTLPQSRADQNVYTLGKLSGHNVVIACLPCGVYGTTSSATVLTQMRSTFPGLQFGLMVGIGGGVPSQSTDIRLGDVVVSVPTQGFGGVIQYDYGKALHDGTFQRTGSLNKPPQTLLSAISKTSSDSMRRGLDIESRISKILNMCPEMGKQFSRPDKDRLFHAGYIHSDENPDCSTCDQSQLVKRPPRTDESHIHYGLIASGNQVMKNAKTRDTIAQDLGILCFEMEAAGLMDHIPCLVIRGICDYCDSHKNKVWQGYAALAAAVYSQVLLSVVPVQAYDTQRIHMQTQETTALSERQIAVLKKLYASQYKDRKDRNTDRIPGTCDWFVTHPIFLAWQASKASQMLWASANPGCGKSVLAKYLADSIFTKSMSCAVGYFFFKEDFEDQKSITNALCRVLHQLFDQIHHLLTEVIIEQFETRDIITSSFSELWNIILSVAKGGNAGEIILLFDALDEREGSGCSQFTEALRRLYTDEGRHDFNLKILLTSRPYNRIRQGFRPLEIPGQPIIHLKNFYEIDLFIQARVEDVKARLRLTEDERNILLERLCCVPNRTYLWVYLTLDLFKDKDLINENGIVEVTSNLPQSVDEAYERILARSTDFQKAKKLLEIVVGAVRPLSLQEMNLALALEEHHCSLSELTLEPDGRFRETIPGICGLFVTIVDSKVYLLHQTAREFLIQEATERTPKFHWRHSVILQETHYILAKICLQYLLLKDFENTSLSTKDVPTLTDDYVFLEYSSTYWANHLLESSIKVDSMISSLLQICDADTLCCQTWLRVYWASLTTEFPTDFTSLMVASYFGLKPVVKHLIQTRIIDLEAKDAVHGRTALSWAAGRGQSAIVELLTKRSWKSAFQRKAVVDSEDMHNRTPLSWAILNGHEDTARLLLQARAAVDKADDIGGTPLYYAISRDHRELSRHMMNSRRGAQIRSTDRLQNVLLISAAQNGHEPVVRMLLDQGVDVELKDHDCDRTLLSWAAGNGHIAVVNILLEAGADLQSKDRKYRQTPLSWAIENGHTLVKRLLLQKAGLNLEGLRKKIGYTVGAVVPLLQHPLSVEALGRLLMISQLDIANQLHSFDPLRMVLNMPTDLNALVNFIYSKGKAWLFNTDTVFQASEGKIHKNIATKCLQTMEISLKQNICMLSSCATDRKAIDNQSLNQYLPEELRYSCCNWVYHLKESNEVLEDEILGFLEEHFLHWMEAMSIMGKVSGVIHMLDTLKSLNITPAQRLSEFLSDAQQFSLKNIEIADSAPLQPYFSGIAFAPEESIVRRTFKDKPLTMMTALPATNQLRNPILQTLKGHLNGVHSVAFSPNSEIVASGSGDATVRLWHTTTGKDLQILQGHSDYISTVAFSPDDQIVASGSRDATVRLWVAKTGADLQTLRGHSGSVHTIAFSFDGRVLASCSFDTALLWDVESGKKLHTLPHLDWINTVVFSPNSSMVASACFDGTVRLWDTETGKSLLILSHFDIAYTVCFSPDGLMMASRSKDYSVTLWSTTTGENLLVLLHSARVSTVTFSPDGIMLASGSQDGIVQLWDTKTGKRLCIFQGHSKNVHSVSFHPNDQTLVSASEDNTIRLWNTTTGGKLRTIQSDLVCFNTVAVSADGLMMVSGGQDSVVRLWDLDFKKRPQGLQGHSDTVNAVAVSPDRRRVVSRSVDQNIRLWDSTTGALCRSVFPTDAVSFMRFSSDGSFLGTGRGIVDIRPFDSDHYPISEEPAPQVCLRGEWVTIGGVKTLWLPVEYRRPSCFATNAGVIVLGYDDGRVCILNFRGIPSSPDESVLTC
ncbi:hypothetical protein FE257_012334 [Aspergillus nanangensis]|uniref:Uncharacterized protein n=1 Tax=Aspergillus nanangensis TaxID=2582783 RepID=A0AAD4CGG9_ASPNN|nr:hypothetical protein FE257_012334 [Aspergillus nanangensis]